MVECSSSPGRRSVSSKAGIRSLTHPNVVITLLSTGCSFSAWYSFSPLSKSIRADLKITNDQWLNSNIIALVAGMVMRAVVGPCCDRFGPRKTSKPAVQKAIMVPCFRADQDALCSDRSTGSRRHPYCTGWNDYQLRRPHAHPFLCRDRGCLICAHVELVHHVLRQECRRYW